MLHYERSLWKEYYPHVKYNPVCIESHKCTFKGRIVCIKYRSRPVHDTLKNILGYIHGKVRMLFTGIEICKNDIKCCIFVILCRYCRLIMFFFLFDKIRIAIYKKKIMIVCKYVILIILDLTHSIAQPLLSLFCKPFTFKLHKFIICLTDIFYEIRFVFDM
jgi:hypothetical protein